MEASASDMHVHAAEAPAPAPAPHKVKLSKYYAVLPNNDVLESATRTDILKQINSFAGEGKVRLFKGKQIILKNTLGF